MYTVYNFSFDICTIYVQLLFCYILSVCCVRGLGIRQAVKFLNFFLNLRHPLIEIKTNVLLL